MEELDLGLPLLGCPACRSVWLSQGQMENLYWDNEKLSSYVEPATELDLGKWCCDDCGVPLHRHKFPTALQVEVTECYGCSGIFLLGSQVKEIRDHSMAKELREAYFQNLVNSVPGYLEHEAEALRGVKGFAKKWQKYRFWAREKKEPET